MQSEFYYWLRSRWQELGKSEAGGRDFEEFWRDSLRRGFADQGAPTQQADPLGLVAAPGQAASAPVEQALSQPARPEQAAQTQARQAELWLWSSVMLHDGRGANRGWLQENPEPLTQLAWGNCIDVHPAQAAEQAIETNDVVELSAGGTKLIGMVRVTEDVAPGTIAMSLGQGHWALGRWAAQRGEARGCNAYALVPPSGAAEQPSPFGTVTFRKLDRRADASYAAATRVQHHRDLIQWVDFDKFSRMKPGEGDQLILPLLEGYRPDKDIIPGHDHSKPSSPKLPPHRWAMVVDLHRCTGCGACAVACYAENNIVVAGADEVMRGRELAWLKVVPYRQDAAEGALPSSAPAVQPFGAEGPARVGWLPMLCQHCDAAPCEPVCPVFASVHNEEGLNVQVYNRCIGTRYCSNNCPYKVRKFNWFNPRWEDRRPLNVQLNPEVTVRCRGVMEKCTFCIQRIRRAEQQAIMENRAVRDGEIQTACQQSCPAGVFTFGDLLDPKSRVSILTRTDPRRYHLLEELNTKVAVTYLRRISIGPPPGS